MITLQILIILFVGIIIGFIIGFLIGLNFMQDINDDVAKRNSYIKDIKDIKDMEEMKKASNNIFNT